MMQLLVRVAVVIGLTLCSAQESYCENNKPLRIGLLAALTGEFASIGGACRDGYELARALYAEPARLNAADQRLEFVYGDIGGSTAQAVSEYKRLTEAMHVSVVVLNLSRVVAAVTDIAARRGIPLFAVTASSRLRRENRLLAQFWPSASAEAAVLTKELAAAKLSRVALVSIEDEYTLSVRDALKEDLRRENVSLVMDELVPSGEGEFRSLLPRLLKLAPDAVLVNLSPVGNGNFVRMLREGGYKGRLYGTFWLSSAEGIQSAGKAALIGARVSQLDFRQPKFLAVLAKHLPGSQATPVTYTCFSALAALLQLVASQEVSIKVEELRTLVVSLSAVRLPDEELRIVDREALYRLRMVEFDGESFR